MAKYFVIAIISGMLSSFSQIMLKKSSEIKRDSVIQEYLNPYVICAYGITFLCMILMVIAYRGLPYKLGAILESLIYLYIMILGKVILNEKLTVKRITGNLIIICGVAIFSL